ncbi:hypothetical protein [Xylophilus ampelinus]|uniref:Uncharacterized protein n=1 Tax=Xylophilus ampelinus TaxID=54067 RepID=A0A318T2G5_9BURK|nr:hypothetical protein [Xylophilus ampelinus]MCS4509173.1 hypothetical protein [Xylophilus ampelinus]PYE79801.1 hypothetical protein DFQ15_101121 [Xylophilus ampelinus]
MNGRRKPRVPRWISSNPIETAKAYAGRLTAAEMQTAMTPVREAFRVLREGVASEMDWATLVTATNVGDAIELQGVVRGVRAHIQAGQHALAGIQQRAMASGAWRPTALYFQELDAISAAVDIHEFQLRQLSFGEYRRAVARAIAEVRSAGGNVIKSTHPGQQQLTLIGACP